MGRIASTFTVSALFVVRFASAHERGPDSTQAPSSLPSTTLPASMPIATEDDTEGFETVVRAERPLSAASAMAVRAQDFLLRPRYRPADILQVTPGLFVAQHAGGGKANQYFLRGFDADHGTDLALSVDGVPVNLVSHAHGQGYADLHWVIPEVIESIDVTKGPYAAQAGDFATAGAIDLITRTQLTRSEIGLTGGMFNTYRGLVLVSPTLERWHPFFAAEVYGRDGPFIHGEHLVRYNVFAKLSFDVTPSSTLALTLTSYASGWNASGQVPERAVAAGTLSPFDTIDASEGGASQRHSAYVAYDMRPDQRSRFRAMAYVVHAQLDLFSNFTFFSRDPVNGDEIEQNDSRTYFGLATSYDRRFRLGRIDFNTTIGLRVRSDVIDNALHYDVKREQLQDVVLANISETSFGLHGQADIVWLSWLRSVIGLRGDYFNFAVSDLLEDRATSGNATSGSRQPVIVSPKASVVLSPLAIPHATLDIFLNFGTGYHSNDARGVVRALAPVTPLTRAIGYEIGARTQLWSRLDLAADFFLTDMTEETVWVGDEGTTEVRGPTRRFGGELEGRVRILDWLFADLDVTVSHATFTQNAGNTNAVALAPTVVLQAGVSLRHPVGIFGRAGAFYVGDRPATEDRALIAKGFLRVDCTVGFHHERFEFAVVVQNLLNAAWREAQFANTSRLASETTAASCSGRSRPATSADGTFVGCEDVHFTPGNPINVQGSAKVFF